MKRILTLIFVTFVTFSGFSQTIVNRDPQIKKMVDEISSANIENTVRKLVSFHTRHNLSEQNNPENGIGAAWNWIKAEMEKSIPSSGGRLTVKFEDYSVGGAGQRISKETKLKNVIATLKGTDPSDDRKILISAHLDSRAALDNDNTGFAPGANDDGSGIAAILELVRIMSAQKFPATIVARLTPAFFLTYS
ncbi:MAG TPA: M28 family peptidase [Bacteroidales bacterium]|nr:M28 family peptidase [Bacteroidales bacterium]